MKRKISFIGMPHSDALEAHSNQKLDRLTSMIKHDEENEDAYSLEFHLKSQEKHSHHRADLHVKIPQMSLHTHDEHPEMYIAVDNTIDKMVSLYRKEKDKLKDKQRKVETDKSKFA
ncbi:ribosome-associated translation inhibitor RaiA [Candidatus Babeliales bacterium]|nr:ribosome-associated translation inhibitor RaiA [Candidatus Babeliales bacterium]